MRNQNSEISVAVHEAGHFVFGELLGLGPVHALTMGHTESADGCRYAGECERDVGIFERLLEQEAAGLPLAGVFEPNPPAAIVLQIRGFIEAYQKNKRAFATALLFYGVAGAAANIELAGDDHNDRGGYSEGDDRNACKGAIFLVKEEEVPAKIEAAMTAARHLCRFHLKGAISMAAQRLRERRTLDKTECAALWCEIRPTLGWFRDLPRLMQSNPEFLFDTSNGIYRGLA